ncbi:alpha-1,3-mannosyl-glycoprotein 4-beta-N-acetylglucosaminyltransferase-like protein MGAT4E [Oryctolagus cuniculus]|uniref:alpha-1,3-mannosyl-glycoprotein 4-beta-N-acetylglucosaminyltransferase-like protein MGAT4E n=1 Tax=Oryctolagus cuniculus TaxID=9986 RepID=UPI0022305B58|nr:alpha-1,3-mannosyl-glycoprotein 4-beta-N-acetylglucosaminyltransferase-like protein MGAT4E [Oryctolagus cuniculus]XP_051677071.1 alpha-1,3-mannosyl-glycoprotein 4-beta-N-acetylglucosaminyltransferase-like protein MGAT4E [Oryctolagus cuniculus]
MRHPIKHCIITWAGITFLWLCITVEFPREIEDDQIAMLVEGQGGGYGSSKSQKPLEDWETISLKYTEKMQRRRKTWLTVGLTAASQQDQKGLLYTLFSLFRSSSKAERKRLTVLVHLADSDLAWLSETMAHLSRLFSPQILAGQLLVIHAPADTYPAVDEQDQAHGGKVYSKQNIDHAFLMSFARNLSDYFLLLEDNIFCAPNFITHIRSKVAAMKGHPWALLEFSNMGFLGKLFHSRDLPLVAHFLLLFHKEKPLARMIAHFRTLLTQESPILCQPFLFYHRMSYPISEDKDRPGHRQSPGSPDNPPASVYTNMNVFSVHFPWEAYTLDESFFWTYNVSIENHLTVILNHPMNLSRVQVLTGSIVDGANALEKGQVELGYSPQGTPQHCTTFILLGHLLEGQMDQKIFMKSMGYHVSCVRLVAKSSQKGGLMIRHIYLWEEKPQM